MLFFMYVRMDLGYLVDFVSTVEVITKSFTRTMGKTRKVSKGYSYGFVPDYRHAVETMADSEGFGLDTEMTASEDSCAPGRKCVPVNGDGDSYEQLGVPIQVLSLSKLSSFERRELGFRLKRELNKLEQEHFGRVFVSVQRCSIAAVPAGRGLFRNIPVDVGPCAAVQEEGSAGSERWGPLEENAAGRVDSVKKSMAAAMPAGFWERDVDEAMRDVVEQHPMDLGTVKTQLLSGKYVDPWAFAGDVRLTFSNAMTYNPRGNDVHIMAETLSKFFEVRWKPIEKKLSVATEAVGVSMRQTVVETETTTLMPPFKKKKTTYIGNEIKQEPVKRSMSDAEKHKLSSELESSLADLPESIIDFLKDNSSNGNQTSDDEIEIDIDTLSDDTLFKLRKLLDDFFVDKQKNMAKAETCEIELHNESGFSNSSMQACKANDANDEDIDIGGNDLHISSFPPVEIEKDTTARNSKCSSSSSSSSDSGSSSSESDSDTSSGSESDGAKASAIMNNNKDAFGSEVNMEQMTAVHGDAEAEHCEFYIENLALAYGCVWYTGQDRTRLTRTGNTIHIYEIYKQLIKDSINGVGPVEQKSQSIAVSGDVYGRQEGESAPSERRVSPDKLYRAALLRSRFADTILKAQEKTIGKGCEKQDRERLRLEKEELEKRRKEEKARLQAEAKAAEEARRNAELEAAAEAKRKREQEREAARQALQKRSKYKIAVNAEMEKMVDINDNSGFLEDLEMLSVAAAEPLESFIDETIADCGEGGFKLTGKGNPLEQLGLYMKDDEDEEEEEEVGPPQVKGGDDPEEGEID
ncbi:LOW QUALITY PROTEIN: hypothetical protein OSB04_004688 [Centaurea solstitialis]|uniref:Uncharacterized protein n=1 Tax=Centaurea solstitialis TaxID=347529 RepID=A0AA38TEJ7_9ASTR|nr:LOW QUALITY PROTEIN: hypothetical protein OSB04_004688 [Centaurea solstitialis]